MTNYHPYDAHLLEEMNMLIHIPSLIFGGLLGVLFTYLVLLYIDARWG